MSEDAGKNLSHKTPSGNETSPETDAAALRPELRRVRAEQDFVRQVEEFFLPGGELSRSVIAGVRSYEFRPQQLEMAKAVAECLVRGENLCVEAPTGVGKSFAYLLPLIRLAGTLKVRSLVSTETIHLQEQLFEKDLPFLAAATGITFKAALAKGRANYLCRRRLSLLSGEERDKILPDELLGKELKKLELYASGDGGSGERDDMDFRLDDSLWGLVCCESMNCAGPKCPHYSGCFYFRARKEWEKSDIIIANHALFFTDLRMKLEGGETESGLLPEYRVAVIDEAHTLENNAAEHLGLHISHAGLRGALNRLYNVSAARGLLMREGDEYLEARKEVKKAHESLEGFFNEIKLLYDEHSDGEYLRFRSPGKLPDFLGDELFRLYEKLRELEDGEKNAARKTELNAYALRFLAASQGLRQFIHMEAGECVYYAEETRYGIELHASPLNVAELLKKHLFTREFPVILCSATLAVRRSFDYFVKRVGFTGGDAFGLDSPFSRDQAEVFVHRSLPDPGDQEEYLEMLREYVPRYLDMTGGKAFVLFTSYRVMRRCADDLEDYFRDNDLELFMQGEDLTRNMMLKKFRASGNGVIFGTDSFWTGVDVPGEALSNVIITKLPFQMPDHPIPAARSERIERSGGRSFSDYSLPEAVLKFRQGLGRLIRSASDRGIIAILDSRVLRKSYGRTFLDAIPYKITVAD